MYRIAQVISSAGVGGGERHLLLLGRYLHGGEFHFSFILPEEGVFCDQLRRAGMPYQVVPMKTKVAVGARRKIRRALQEMEADLAHCHGARANWYGRTAARRAGAVLFCTVHNSLKDYPYPSWRRRLYLALERRTAPLVDQWIAVSNSIRKDLVEYYRVPAAKIEVIANGVDPLDLQVQRTREQVRRDLSVADGDLVLLAAARMTEQKGHRFLLEAVSTLRNRWGALRCLLAGDGPARPRLERQARELGIADRVRFLGFRSDIPDLIRASDIYVLPSLSEGMPLGLLEAMALGCPVVACAVSGVPEIVRDRINGLLAPPADAPALARLLGELAAHPEMRLPLASAAQATVQEHFTARAMAGRVGELYRRRIGARS